MKFSFVIPNVTKSNEKLNLLKSCLETFRKFHGAEHELIVVDDGSDITYQVQISRLCDFHGAQFIAKINNEGFSTTVNVGMRKASGDVVVILNNDLSFTQDISKFLKEDFKKDEKIGVVGALLFYPDGTIQHGGVARSGYNFTHIGWHKRYDGAPEVQLSKYLIGVTGALFAIRRKCFEEVGLFDETYFLACEDTQYCLRAWQNEWRVYYDPRVRAIHVEGGTRENTTQKKLTSSIDTRNWYIKELQTSEKFLKWVKTIDFMEIERRVNDASISHIENQLAVNIKAEVKSGDIVHSSRVSETVPLQSIGKKQFVKSGKVVGIHRAGALGDVLLATPVIREFKKRNPGVQIVFSTMSRDAVNRNPYVDHVVGSLDELKAHTDVVYNLDLAYENSPKKHVTQAYAKAILGQEISDLRMDMESSVDDFTEVVPFMSNVNFERDKVICVHMSMSWENRTWSKAYWSTLIKNLVTRGYKVLVLGRGGDYRSDLMAGVYNLVDRLNVFQVREVIKRSHCFVGTDSGLMHIAQTTETPVVGIFTVANPIYRVTREKDTTSLIPTSLCRFCLHEEVPPVTFVGCKIKTMQCLKEITPVQVFHEIVKYL